MESPNFPGEYPAESRCTWTVKTKTKRVLVVISNIDLGEDCQDKLTITKTGKCSISGFLQMKTGFKWF